MNKARTHFRNLVRRYPRVTSLLLVLLSSLLCLVLTVGVLELVLEDGERLADRRYKFYDLFSPDPDLGTVLQPNAAAHTIGFFRGEKIFDVAVTTDSFGRRITPKRQSAEDKFIAIFGCSVAFGLGSKDEDSLPYILADKLPSLQIYNYAVPGYGTNHVLRMLKNRDLRDEIPERSGHAVYVLIADHMWRLLGTRSHMWAWNGPYFSLQGGTLVDHRTSIASGKPNTTRVLQLLNRSNLARRLQLDLPLRLRGQHYDLMTAIIVDAKNEFLREFPDGTFYVYLHEVPNPYTRDFERRLFDAIRSRLEDAGIPIIECAMPQEYLLPDSHPRRAANETSAECIAAALLNTQSPIS